MTSAKRSYVITAIGIFALILSFTLPSWAIPRAQARVAGLESVSDSEYAQVNATQLNTLIVTLIGRNRFDDGAQQDGGVAGYTIEVARVDVPRAMRVEDIRSLSIPEARNLGLMDKRTAQTNELGVANFPDLDTGVWLVEVASPTRAGVVFLKYQSSLVHVPGWDGKAWIPEVSLVAKVDTDPTPIVPPTEIPDPSPSTPSIHSPESSAQPVRPVVPQELGTQAQHGGSDDRWGSLANTGVSVLSLLILSGVFLVVGFVLIRRRNKDEEES